jgi:hypothetical protein
MIEIKPIIVFSGIGLFALTALLEPSESKESECRVNIEELERQIDAKLIEQSHILGHTAIVKDSSVKVLHKECKVLKKENKELKTDIKGLQLLATKAPDTVVKTIIIKEKVGLFGKNKFDTLNN